MEEKTEKLEISKGAKIAAKWWADHFDGTVAAPSMLAEIEELKSSLDDEEEWFREKVLAILTQAALEAENKPQYISKEQSEKLRKNLEILLQKSLNEYGHEWLATDDDRAWGVLALACYFAGIEHDELLSLPLNVMMHVRADKVEIDYSDTMQSETIYDEKQEAILHGKIGQERNL